MNNESPNQTKARVEQAQERETHLRHLREQEAVQRIISASPVQFKNLDAVLQAIPPVRFDADGNPVSGGIPLSDALIAYSRINPQNTAGTIDERHDHGASTVKSKADLKTVADKVSYVREFGELAFARLPATTVEKQQIAIDQLTWQQYQGLNRAERMKVIAEKGDGFVARLRHAADEEERLKRLTGVPRGK